MSRNLICLLYPTRHNEWEIQETLQDFWQVIFPDYELLNPRSLLSGRWQPDLFARRHVEGSGWEYLVGEIKRTNRSGNLADTTTQLIEYGRRLVKEYPNIRLRLLMLGHWSREEAEPWCKPFHDEQENFSIAYIPLKEIGEVLLEKASDALYRLHDFYRSPIAIDEVPYSDFTERLIPSTDSSSTPAEQRIDPSVQ